MPAPDLTDWTALYERASRAHARARALRDDSLAQAARMRKPSGRDATVPAEPWPLRLPAEAPGAGDAAAPGTSA